MVIDSVFFKSLKGKKFLTRHGVELTLNSIYASGVMSIILHLTDPTGKNHTYDSLRLGKVLAGVDSDWDIISEL